MSIETAIVRIIDNWDDWEAEAGQAAQVEQDPRAGEAVMKRHLRDVLEKLAARDPTAMLSNDDVEGCVDPSITQPRCYYCGQELTLVRPGKHQCDNEECSSNHM